MFAICGSFDGVDSDEDLVLSMLNFEGGVQKVY